MRVQTIVPLSALVCLGVVFTGCSDSATEPGLRDAVTLQAPPAEWFDLNFTTYDNCNGEDVAFTTRRINRVSLKEDGAGGFHWSYHRTWIGTGVGQVTGTEYTFNWPWQTSENVKPPFPHSFTRTVNNNLVSKGNADNRIFHNVWHFTVNANGETTADLYKTVFKCVG